MIRFKDNGYARAVTSNYFAYYIWLWDNKKKKKNIVEETKKGKKELELAKTLLYSNNIS